MSSKNKMTFKPVYMGLFTEYVVLYNLYTRYPMHSIMLLVKNIKGGFPFLLIGSFH